MFGLELKKIALPIAAVFALGIGTSTVQASTTSVCPDDGSGTREFTLTTENPISNSCYFWGDNNDSNDDAFNMQRETDFGMDHVLLAKVEDDGGEEGSFVSVLDDMKSLLGELGGTFTLDATGFDNVLLVFKSGLGGSTPGFAAFSLTPSGFTEGEWSVNLQQALSHVSLYGTPAAIPLPAGGLLLITALGGLGIAARRRRKAT